MAIVQKVIPIEWKRNARAMMEALLRRYDIGYFLEEEKAHYPYRIKENVLDDIAERLCREGENKEELEFYRFQLKRYLAKLLSSLIKEGWG